MATARRQLIKLIEQGAIPEEKVEDALTLLEVIPKGRNWLAFIDRFLLWLGGLAVAFSVLFFVAYNWRDLGTFTKFAMVEALLILAIVAYCRLADNSLAGKMSLVMATIFLGVLLALFGQTYQTGADPWQLFFTWAVLMLPWTFIARFPAIWIIWISLLNISIILYYQTFRSIFWFVFSSESGMLWAVFILNTAAFVSWQLLAKIWPWLKEDWAVRLLGASSGIPLTTLVILTIFDYPQTAIYPWFAWIIWIVIMYAVYRKIRLDLFMLAGCCLSVITVTVSFFGEQLLPQSDAAGFLLLAFITIIMGGGATMWLKNIHRESLS